MKRLITLMILAVAIAAAQYNGGGSANVTVIVLGDTTVNLDSLGAVVMQATRGRFGTIYGATLSGNFLGGGTDSLGNLRVVQATRGRFTNIFGNGAGVTAVDAATLQTKDTTFSWPLASNAAKLQTKDTTYFARLSSSNTFTGVSQTVSGAVPMWRLVQTNDTSKWWIDATDTVRHYSNKPIIWMGAWRYFLNASKYDSMFGTSMTATRAYVTTFKWFGVTFDSVTVAADTSALYLFVKGKKASITLGAP